MVANICFPGHPSQLENLLPSYWGAAGRKLSTIKPLMDFFSWRRLPCPGHAPFPAAHIQWLINEWYRAQPSPPNSGELGGTIHFQISLQRIWSSTETTLQLNFTVCSTLLPSLPIHRCWYQKHFFNKPLASWSPSQSLLLGKSKQGQWWKGMHQLLVARHLKNMGETVTAFTLWKRA